MKKNKIILLCCCIVLLLIYGLTSILPAKADVFDNIKSNLQTFTGAAGLTKANEPMDIVINIINVILTFLALLFIIMILYGGFTYLTAAGNADNAKKAVGIIKDAVIGVVIVVLSGIFVNYILIKIIEFVQ